VVRADTRLDVNHRVRKLMGVRKLSFADGDETAQLTGMQIGGVTALALPADLVIYGASNSSRSVRGGCAGGARADSPRWVRMRRMTSGSSMAARMRMGP
jgi:prolyl-tRNA editing enzyme YbaK/EbsC (Cys-tRNA(Pro) deacylase)